VLQVFTQYGRAGASSRVRVYQWLERVAADHHMHPYAGTSTVSAEVLGRHPARTLRGELAARRAHHRSSDPVLIHRAATPMGRGGVEAHLLRHGRPGVFDFDDALQWEAAGAGLARQMFPRAVAAVRSVAAADRVIAGNATLADWASAHNPDVRLIPSCIEPGYYVRKRDFSVNDPPVIGWIGSVSTERYLETIAGPLLEVHRRTGAVVVIVGAPVDRPGPLEEIVRRVPWTEAVVHNQAASWDVGIMPLADGLYERGKCGYKLLQYAAAGLPVLGSPVGVNREILAAMGAGAPASDAEWVDALVHVLGSSAASRAALGGRALGVVEHAYSYEAWQDRWVDAVGLDGPRPNGQPLRRR
jgi:glycosyltransferase involved in cell wall biosynthesis